MIEAMILRTGLSRENQSSGAMASFQACWEGWALGQSVPRKDWTYIQKGAVIEFPSFGLNHSSAGFALRDALMPPRRRLPSRRRTLEPSVGRVGRRGVGRTAAARMSSISRV